MLNATPHFMLAALFTLLIAFTVHEFAHAWAATQLGDMTPRLAGRLTLNPLVHLDFFGSIMLLIAGFGWAKPVPVNKAALRQRYSWGPMLVSLSGPLSNLLLAILAALVLRFGNFPTFTSGSSLMPSMPYILWIFMRLNIALFLFNLMPIPPLDGEEILSFLLPRQLGSLYESIRPYGTTILLALLVIGPMLNFNFFDLVLRPLMVAIEMFLLGA